MNDGSGFPLSARATDDADKRRLRDDPVINLGQVHPNLSARAKPRERRPHHTAETETPAIAPNNPNSSPTTAKLKSNAERQKKHLCFPCASQPSSPPEPIAIAIAQPETLVARVGQCLKRHTPLKAKNKKEVRHAPDLRAASHSRCRANSGGSKRHAYTARITPGPVSSATTSTQNARHFSHGANVRTKSLPPRRFSRNRRERSLRRSTTPWRNREPAPNPVCPVTTLKTARREQQNGVFAEHLHMRRLRSRDSSLHPKASRRTDGRPMPCLMT